MGNLEQVWIKEGSLTVCRRVEWNSSFIVVAFLFQSSIKRKGC